MTRDDIIRLAREAGIDAESDTLCRHEGWVEPLERFADLIAASERDALRAEVERLRAALAPVAQDDDMQQCKKTLAACPPESPLHALSQKALAALDKLDAPDHEAWRAKLWELIDAYRKGHDWPLAMRDRIKAHIAKMPAAPAPVLTPAQQHADDLLSALTHLHHNARASGAEMGLALDVAGALLAKVKATGQEGGA